MIVKKYVFSGSYGDKSDYQGSLRSMYNSLNCSLLSVNSSGNCDVSIGSKIRIYSYNTIKDMDGNTLMSVDLGNWVNNVTYTYIYDNNNFIAIIDSSRSTQSSGGCHSVLIVIFQTIGNNHYYGAYVNNYTDATYNAPVENLQLTCDADNLTYNYRKMLNFSAESDAILYTSAGLFQSDLLKVPDTGFYSCSDIPNYTTITINGNNYFALSKNLLIPLDSN